MVQKMAVRDDGQEGVVAESESEDIRFNKQFYFLHIKIQSAQAGALLFWRFDVIIVDTTEEVCNDQGFQTFAAIASEH